MLKVSATSTMPRGVDPNQYCSNLARDIVWVVRFAREIVEATGTIQLYKINSLAYIHCLRVANAELSRAIATALDRVHLPANGIELGPRGIMLEFATLQSACKNFHAWVSTNMPEAEVFRQEIRLPDGQGATAELTIPAPHSVQAEAQKLLDEFEVD